jgi:RNA-directed DNA polymerase
MEIETIAEILNPKLRGWINYYGLYSKSKLTMLMNYLERKITKWIRNKFKIGSVKESYSKLKSIKQVKPILFYHWEKGY